MFTPDSHIETIIGIISLLLILFCCSRFASKSRKSLIKHSKAPEPHGALPIIGHLHLFGGPIPIARTLASMADKYGSIFSVRLGCNQTLVVSSQELAKECLAKNDLVFATRPNIAAGRHMGYNNAIFALAPYGQYWRDMRKMATLELLSTHRLQLLSHIRDSEIYSFLKHLYSNFCSKNTSMDDYNMGFQLVPISKLFDHLTFNINSRMISGKRYSNETFCQTNGEHIRLKNAIKDATYLSGVFVVGDAIPYLGWLDVQGHLSFMKRTAKEIDSVLSNWLDEHMRKKAEGFNSESEKDFMDVMISSLPDDAVSSGHTRDTIVKATAMILMLTGTGSTAMTLAWTLSLLLNNPRVLKAAQQELDNQIGHSKWVQESDIKNLNYLQAIVKETLRLYPPAPLTGIREAMSDCSVGGYHVTKGTRLLVNIWKLQRDPSVWSRPCEFEPERFLTQHQDIDYKGNFEYIPFSSGRRGCPGVTFGLQVVHLTLARLLQGFDIATEGGALVDMSEGLGVAMPKLKPLQVVIKPRLPIELYQRM